MVNEWQVNPSEEKISFTADNEEKISISKDGELSSDSIHSDQLSNIQIVSPDDNLQERLDEFGDSPVTYLIPSGTFTAPEYGFRVYSNTTIVGDRNRTIIEANAPNGSGSGSDKYAFLNINHHQATNVPASGNDNIHLEGLTVRGSIRLTADVSQGYTQNDHTLKNLDCLDTDDWLIHLRGTDNVLVQNVYCDNMGVGADNGGNDGVHLTDCQDSTIEHVSGTTGDDLVSLGSKYRLSRSISVRDVRGKSGLAALLKIYNHEETTASEGHSHISASDIYTDDADWLVKFSEKGAGKTDNVTIERGGATNTMCTIQIPPATSDVSNVTIRDVYGRNHSDRGIVLGQGETVLENIRLDGTSASNAVGLEVNGETILKNCSVSNFTAHGYSIGGKTDMVDCSVENCDARGIYATEQASVLNCSARNVTRGVDLNAPSSLAENVDVFDSNQGVHIAASNCKVDGITTSNITYEKVFIESGTTDTVVNVPNVSQDDLAMDGSRIVLNGWGTNTGDPSAGNGQWAGNGYEGLNIYDTTNGVKYSYINGAWV